jgi:hypothetical protein
MASCDTVKRKRAAEKAGVQEDKYRSVTRQSTGKWVVCPRVGFARVPGTHNDAKSAAEAAAAAWKVPLNTFVKTNSGVASRLWTATDFWWIWQRGPHKYVLKRKIRGEDFAWCASNPEELVARAMKEWGLTMAELTRAKVTRPIPGGVPEEEDEEVPATQPYPDDVLAEPHGELPAKREQAG